MRRWRWLVLAVLFAAPVLVLIGFGIYSLWATGWGFWIGWPLTASLALGYFLVWRWQKQQHLLRLPPTVPLIWTERDHEAWRLVEARAKAASQLSADELTSLNFYIDTARSLALELARFYHPGAKDPVGSLTIPEMLAAVELAARDLAEMVDQYLPGGHLLTVNDFRRFKQVADWYPTISNISWLISSVFAPINTALRYLAVQASMNRPWKLLQENVLVWFVTAYVNRLGTYLIDLNSGRLRVGAQRYLQLKNPLVSPPGPVSSAADPSDAVRTVTFALVGQTKAGKSSLINALLGEQRAFTDVLPATADLERYELQPPGIATRFQLLDTVGYGNQGPRQDQLRVTETAARQADVVLLVLHARDPARQADLDLLQDLREYFATERELQVPPVLAVMTHIDLLSPSLEWSPPYDWQQPQRPKEQQIHEAVEAIRDQFGPLLAGVIPVSTAPGKVYGVQEWLLPSVTSLLDQAHAVAFLRCLKAETNLGKVSKIFDQLLSVGKGLVNVLWQGQLPLKR